MRVAIREVHTQSCVSCWWHCRMKGEDRRPLLKVRVVLICREGCMALCPHKV